MPWTCRIVSNEREAKTPGDMWAVTTEDYGINGWIVLLPDGSDFCIQSKSSDGTPWDVTGEAPNFTVSPSIARHGITHPDGFVWRKGWHGWLQGGILSDDCEGRTYEEGWAMIYTCFCKGEYIGICSLSAGQVDPPGTGHMFGDVCYTLVETKDDAMYFTKDEDQPYIKKEEA